MTAVARVAHFDCFSGISGDMVLGALVDAGGSRDRLRSLPGLLKLDPEPAIEIETAHRGPLRGTRVTVRVSDRAAARSVGDLREMVARASLPARVVAQSLQSLEALARAEARVHGAGDLDSVHLHEAGGLDALIDLVGAHLLLDDLAIERWTMSAVACGSGWVESAHGRLPLPAPGALEILAGAGAALRPVDTDLELVTPTGAAAIAPGASGFQLPALFLEGTGYGLGERELSWPNALRVLVGRPATEPGSAGGLEVQSIDVLEAEVDDMAGTMLAELVGRLLESGALDAYLTPVIMKKGRPGHVVTALAPAGLGAELATVLIAHSSSLGCRLRTTTRLIAERQMIAFETSLGLCRYKVSEAPGRGVRAEPEMEDCRRLASASGLTVMEAHRRLVAESLSLAGSATGSNP
ncbi:MAG: nickel pincer cofactor biosynthesis protein LarC [Candidatus Dormibacteria bacterium]